MNSRLFWNGGVVSKKLVAVLVIVYICFVAPIFLNLYLRFGEAKDTVWKRDFNLVFGQSLADHDLAQVAVDTYFVVMLNATCDETKEHYGNPGDKWQETVFLSHIKRLEMAQEIAEAQGFSVPLEYKKFRYGTLRKVRVGNDEFQCF